MAVDSLEQDSGAVYHTIGTADFGARGLISGHYIHGGGLFIVPIRHYMRTMTTITIMMMKTTTNKFNPTVTPGALTEKGIKE
jgi:hypothetical protein